jgi:hypothetical protein
MLVTCYLCEKTIPNSYLKDDKTFRKEYHKSCWAEIERKQAENDRIQLEKQQEISNNFQISEEQQAEMETEGATLDPDDYSYPHESQATFKDWEEHEATLDKEKIIELILKPNKFRFKTNKLVLKNYPKLQTLYANSCALKSVEIDCPSLRSLWLNDNELESIDLSKVPNLRNLTISNNNLKELNVKHLKNLETLWCFKNLLRGLDCSNLSKLEELDCSANAMTPFDAQILVSGDIDDENAEWKTVRRFTSHFKKLKLDGCSNLEVLDADLNSLGKLDFSCLTSLQRISVRQNCIVIVYREAEGEWFSYRKKQLILNSPHLTHIDVKLSDVKEIINESENKAKIIDNDTDEGYCNDNEDKPTDWEQHAYERQQAKQQKAFEEGKHTWVGQVCLDLSGRDYIKSITIDGDKNYPKSLVSINLGDNYLEEVVVKNMPNLSRLIISHNKVNNLVIENCPQLDLLYDYKSGDENRQAPTDGKVYDDEKDNPIKKEEESESTESEQNFLQITQLIQQIEVALVNNNLTETSELLTELKELAQKPIKGIDKVKLQAKINDLESRLAELTSQINQSQSIPTKLIVGSVTVGLVIIGILVWLVKKQISLKRK